MTKIEKILNRDFLLRLVSIESLRFYTTVDTTLDHKGLISIAELEVMVIEPDKNNISKENIYELKLFNVKNIITCLGETDENSFIFDTDEVTLKLESKNKGEYELKFINATVQIKISFNNITLKKIK